MYVVPESVVGIVKGALDLELGAQGSLLKLSLGPKKAITLQWRPLYLHLCVSLIKQAI